MLPTEYTENFQVYRHDGDCYGCVQPATMLRYAQQIAGEHAIALGLDDALYARTHTAYVLVKQALRFDRVPRVDEHLTLITKPEALKRAVNKRITQVLDAEGRQAALVDSRWVLIDTDKRAILRRHPEDADRLGGVLDLAAAGGLRRGDGSALPEKARKRPRKIRIRCQKKP